MDLDKAFFKLSFLVTKSKGGGCAKCRGESSVLFPIFFFFVLPQRHSLEQWFSKCSTSITSGTQAPLSGTKRNQ